VAIMPSSFTNSLFISRRVDSNGRSEVQYLDGGNCPSVFRRLRDLYMGFFFFGLERCRRIVMWG